MALSNSRLWMGGALLALVIVAALLFWWPRNDGEAEFQHGDMVVSAPWARATPGALRIGAVYLMITNDGATPDRLLRAETPVAERVELHINEMSNGVMRMRPVESVALPPRQAVRFEPSGMHLMLVNLAEPLQQGGRFPMRLVFERAGVLELEVTVGAVGASQAPDGMDHGGGSGSHMDSHTGSHTGHDGHPTP